MNTTTVKDRKAELGEMMITCQSGYIELINAMGQRIFELENKVAELQMDSTKDG